MNAVRPHVEEHRSARAAMRLEAWPLPRSGPTSSFETRARQCVRAPQDEVATKVAAPGHKAMG